MELLTLGLVREMSIIASSLTYPSGSDGGTHEGPCKSLPRVPAVTNLIAHDEENVRRWHDTIYNLRPAHERTRFAKACHRRSRRSRIRFTQSAGESENSWPQFVRSTKSYREREK